MGCVWRGVRCVVVLRTVVLGQILRLVDADAASTPFMHMDGGIVWVKVNDDMPRSSRVLRSQSKFDPAGGDLVSSNCWDLVAAVSGRRVRF
jgi:hypothetical protein